MAAARRAPKDKALAVLSRLLLERSEEIQAVNREDLDLTDGADLEAERAFDVLGCAAALGIIKTGSGSGFYTVEHVRLLHLVRYWFYFLRSRTKSAICMRILRSAQSGVFSRASRALER